MKKHFVRAIKEGILFLTQHLSVYAIGRKKLRIVMYHGVDDIDFPVGVFESHLRFLTHHFETFFATEIPQLLKNNFQTSSGKPPIVLTFDDGLRNNALIVAPLIKKYHAKATFYLISGLLEGGQMMWNHELFCRLSLLDDKDIARATTDLNFSDAPLQATKAYIEKAKKWPQARRLFLMDYLRREFGVQSYTEQMKQSYEIMSLQDAQNLPSCIEVGSHTATHPILTTVSDETINYEVSTSKSQLEQLLGKPIKTFCYPNGDYTAYAVDLVKVCYDVAVTTQEGFVYAEDDLSQLKRVSSRVSLVDMSYRLLFPG